MRARTQAEQVSSTDRKGQDFFCCGSLVDKPVSESPALHLCTRVIEDVLPARIHRAAVALVNTVTIDWVRLPAPWVFWRLFLILKPTQVQASQYTYMRTMVSDCQLQSSRSRRHSHGRSPNIVELCHCCTSRRLARGKSHFSALQYHPLGRGCLRIRRLSKHTGHRRRIDCLT